MGLHTKPLRTLTTLARGACTAEMRTGVIAVLSCLSAGSRSQSSFAVAVRPLDGFSGRWPERCHGVEPAALRGTQGRADRL